MYITLASIACQLIVYPKVHPHGKDIIKPVFDDVKVHKTLPNALKHFYCEHLPACCASANSANMIG